MTSGTSSHKNMRWFQAGMGQSKVYTGFGYVGQHTDVRHVSEAMDYQPHKPAYTILLNVLPMPLNLDQRPLKRRHFLYRCEFRQLFRQSVELVDIRLLVDALFQIIVLLTEFQDQ